MRADCKCSEGYRLQSTAWWVRDDEVIVATYPRLRPAPVAAQPIKIRAQNKYGPGADMKRQRYVKLVQRPVDSQPYRLRVWFVDGDIGGWGVCNTGIAHGRCGLNR